MSDPVFHSLGVRYFPKLSFNSAKGTESSCGGDGTCPSLQYAPLPWHLGMEATGSWKMLPKCSINGSPFHPTILWLKRLFLPIICTPQRWMNKKWMSLERKKLIWTKQVLAWKDLRSFILPSKTRSQVLDKKWWLRRIETKLTTSNTHGAHDGRTFQCCRLAGTSKFMWVTLPTSLVQSS